MSEAVGSKTGWRGFIQALAEQQVATYAREPLELVSHANREQTALDGYRGRQLLELLQNADDAANGSATSRLRIEIARTGVVAANTGAAFSERGIKSLVISDASPKQLAQNRFIGCKGLGFRSVLTWTRSPVVVSGNAAVEFSATRAEATIRELAGTNPDLAAEVSRYSESGRSLPVPVMRFPRSIADDEITSAVMDIRKRGFETAIVIPFEDGAVGDHAFAEALEQLHALTPETLLFCRNLELVEVAGAYEVSYSLLREVIDGDRYSVVISDASAKRMWTVHRRLGRIPETAMASTANVSRNFELAVAVPSELETAAEGGCLCVYFPTREQLPIPLRLHGTFELTEDRNRLVRPHEANAYVLAQLAELIGDVVEIEAAAGGGVRALALIDGLQAADPSLRDFGFVDRCGDALARRRIFPRIDGTTCFLQEVRRAPDRIWYGVLDGELCPELLEPAAHGSNALSLFALSWYSPQELTTRLQAKIARLTPSDAGALVGTMLKAYSTREVDLGALIVDTDGRPVGAGIRCFFHPSVKVALGPLPAWAESVRFMDPAFQAELLRVSGAGSLRILGDRLGQRAAKIEEYKLESVARVVISSLGEGLEESDRSGQLLRWRELLQWLWQADRRGADLSGLDIQVPNRAGSLTLAEGLLLGDPYPHGAVLHRLYAQVGDGQFVATPDKLGVPLPAPELEQFLLSLGVRSLPRLVDFPRELVTAFLAATLERQTFPIGVRGEVCGDPQAIRSHCRYIDFDNLKIPNRLHQLLLNGDAAAIIAYMIGDGADLIAQEFDETASLLAIVGNERQYRAEPNIRVPNPVLWMLREVTWVPSDDGARRRPREIILSEAGARAFANVFWRHAIDANDPLLRERGGKEAVAALLTRLGAVTSLESVSEEAIYRLLERLPIVDPDGKTAGRIYSTLVEAALRPGDSVARTRFCSEGRIWTRAGSTGRYVPVANACYNTNLSLPRSIERELPLIDLARRKNSKVVERIFGVRSLQASEVRLTVNEGGTRIDPTTDAADAALKRALKYVYAIRLSKRADEDGRERRLLNRMRLRVCERVEVGAELPNNAMTSLVLDKPGAGIAVDADLYLVAAFIPQGASTGRFWQWVANLMAEVLGADVSAELALVLRCRSPEEMADTVRDLVGEGADEKLAEAELRIDAAEDVAPPPTYSVSPAKQASGEPAGAEDPNPASASDDEPSFDDEPSSDNEPSAGDDGARADDAEAEPANENESGQGAGFSVTGAPPPTKRGTRKLVVSREPAASSGGGNGPVATEDVTFRVVEAFEELASPPRYAIRVSHLRGDDGPGCDLVSVASEEIRQRVLADQEIEDSDILRYIEVKGRSSRTGQIDLDGNEAKRAAEARERYFLYRVYIGEVPGRYEVGVLGDPLFSKAVRFVACLDLSAGSGAEWFLVREE